MAPDIHQKNFEDVYDHLCKIPKHSDQLRDIERKIYDFFSSMTLPDEPTIYDYLVLSLRPKDIIATFNWDPFLGQAFARNMDVVGYENMPRMAYLHGNVKIGICRTDIRKGWIANRCDACGRPFEPTKLLYPVGDKDYETDLFIRSEWSSITASLQEAYWVTVFGYSAPKTDVAARELLASAWKANQTTDFGLIEVIDVAPPDEVKANWAEFTVRNNLRLIDDYFSSYLAMHPRRTCEALAMATLQQRPWKDDPVPQNVTLEELQQAILKLVAEETGRLSGMPLAST